MDTTTKIWPASESEKQLGWTAKYPRPTEKNGHHPAVVETRQAEWDQAEALRQKYARRADEIRAAREAQEQAERDRIASEAERKRQALRAGDEAMLKRRFVTAGGSEQEWESEKEEVIRDHRKRQMGEAERQDAAARAAQSVLYRTF